MHRVSFGLGFLESVKSDGVLDIFQQVPGVMHYYDSSVVRYPMVNLEASKEIWEELHDLDVEQKGVSHDMKPQRNTMNIKLKKVLDQES